MRKVFIFFIAGVFMFIAPFLFVMELRPFIGWLSGFAWLSLWGPLTALLNAIMMGSVLDQMHVFNEGLSMASRYLFWTKGAENMAIMGYLSWMVPMLSAVVVGWLGFKTTGLIWASSGPVRSGQAAGNERMS